MQDRIIVYVNSHSFKTVPINILYKECAYCALITPTDKFIFLILLKCVWGPASPVLIIFSHGRQLFSTRNLINSQSKHKMSQLAIGGWTHRSTQLQQILSGSWCRITGLDSQGEKKQTAYLNAKCDLICVIQALQIKNIFFRSRISSSHDFKFLHYISVFQKIFVFFPSLCWSNNNRPHPFRF